MPFQITFTANGERHSVAAGTSLGDFLQSRGQPPGLVIVIRNGRPLAPSEAAALTVENGDRLEITPGSARRP